MLKLEAAITHFPGTPRSSVTSTETCPSATSGEPDPFFGVLHRSGEEARGECSQRGGGCEAKGCRLRDDTDFRVERIAGRRTASCSPLDRNVKDVRATSTHNARGFRSRIGTIEVFGCGALALTGRVASRVGAARWFHTSRGGFPTEVNSVVVNTSIRSDVATESIGHQLWQWELSEPISIDGDVERWWIIFSISSIACSSSELASLALLARGQVREWVAKRVGEASHPGPDAGFMFRVRPRPGSVLDELPQRAFSRLGVRSVPRRGVADVQDVQNQMKPSPCPGQRCFQASHMKKWKAEKA